MMADHDGRVRGARKPRRQSRWQLRVLFPILRIMTVVFLYLLGIRLRIQTKEIKPLNKNRQGCIVLANHQSNIDSFVINISLNRQIQYLVSDSNVRSALAKGLFWLVGAIPKTKFMRDFNALRIAIQTVQIGGIVGIFPEGLCSWDGTSTDAIDGTAKLIKLIRAPVYVARIHGTYFVLPRWSRGARSGRAEVTFQQLLTPAEIAACTADQIQRKINGAIRVDSQQLQQKTPRHYRGRRHAEYCEQFLFLCPLCARVGTLNSRRNTISCTACGTLAKLDPYYHLHWIAPPEQIARFKGTSLFTHLTQWNTWQKSHWRARLRRLCANYTRRAAAPPLVLPAEQTIVKTGYRQRRLVNRGHFDMSITADGMLHYRARAGTGNGGNSSTGTSTTDETSAAAAATTLESHVTAIAGCNVQNGEILEYYRGNTLYHLRINNKRRNAYKWMLTIQYLTAYAPARPGATTA